jgi:hypothetical protein
MLRGGSYLMKAAAISDYRLPAFQMSLDHALANPPKGYFVQDVQYMPVGTNSSVTYTAVIVYGEIPTT